MFAAGSSIDDTLPAVPPAPFSPMVTNTDDRTRILPPYSFGIETAVLITVGQSLMANYVGGEKLNGGPSILQVNLRDGALYVAQDPLLGIDTFIPDPNSNSNFAIRLAQDLIASGRYARVILLPIAVGGTVVARWVPGDIFAPRIGVAGARLRALGLTCTAILWQQGTTDNTASTPGSTYQAQLLSVIASFRAAGFGTTPFFVAQDTWYAGSWSLPVRAAQRAVVNPAAGIYAGPDIDLITDRRDVAHMTAIGGQKQADAWCAALRAVLG